jgi:purine-nucleoside phosphorylase
MSAEGAPFKSAAAGHDLVSALATRASRTHGLAVGVHAVVPGPQYETPAELAVLRALGVATVSMSGAAETRAARERHLETAMLAVVTNVGETSHDEVLLNTGLAGQALAAAVSLVLSSWGLVAPAH